MTIERAKSELMQIYGALSPSKQQAIDMLVKIKPCRDAIPRTTAINLVNDVQNNRGFWDYKYYEYLYDHLSTMPSVNPQEPKTGHWAHDGSYWKNRFICSECGYKLFDEPTNYCPYCGARMESEDKE